MPDSMTAVVRFRRVGFHRWPQATGRRAYLASPHRHLFFVQVAIAVTHDHREIEFHDLLDQCLALWPDNQDLKDLSCESMARELVSSLVLVYGDRPMCVSVFEDDEVGAVIDHNPEGATAHV